MAVHRSLPLPAPGDLIRGFADRNALEQFLRQQFPAAALIDAGLSPVPGGRKAAELVLRRLDPVAYNRNRNFLHGAVSQLSPYVRHGLLGLAELKDWLISQKRPWRDQEKFISELAWREFWQRVWQQRGDQIWQDIELLKTGHLPESYNPVLPIDVLNGETGLACIDAFQQQLVSTGWLHNHARMWLASYLVHWRRISWQAGAHWFLQHLIDADPASNNLSWQWVASCFSSKPYIFNRENLEKYAGNKFCNSCPAASNCLFDASYEELQKKLFLTNNVLDDQSQLQPPLPTFGFESTTTSKSQSAPNSTFKFKNPLLWIHAEGLGPANPVWQAWPQAPALFVFNTARLEAEGIGLKRVGFVFESLLEVPVVLRNGDPAAEILEFAARCGCDGVVTQAPQDPYLQKIITALGQHLEVEQLAVDPFVVLETPYLLRRFTRFWKQAQPLLQQQFSS